LFEAFLFAPLHRNIQQKQAHRARGVPQAAVGGLPRKRAARRVFVLGGTGLIGSPVARELVGRGRRLFRPARSYAPAAKLDQFGVTTNGGDIARVRPD
jgi:hypothetical protein